MIKLIIAATIGFDEHFALNDVIVVEYNPIHTVLR